MLVSVWVCTKGALVSFLELVYCGAQSSDIVFSVLSRGLRALKFSYLWECWELEYYFASVFVVSFLLELRMLVFSWSLDCIWSFSCSSLEG